jgi:hypothetical protein
MNLGFRQAFRRGPLGRWCLSAAGLIRDSVDDGFGPRILAEFALVAALVFGGFLIGRLNALGDASAPDDICITTQASTLTAPTPQKSTPLAQASLAEARPVPPPAMPTSSIPTFSMSASSMSASSTSALSVASSTDVSATANRDKPKVPRDGPSLSIDEVRETQAWLKAFGFDPGPLDGLRGTLTAAAVKRYQAARHSEETGMLDRALLRQIRREAGHS